jgi:ABC-type oligopeptide transport system substrate-binding subunit
MIILFLLGNLLTSSFLFADQTQRQKKQTIHILQRERPTTFSPAHCDNTSCSEILMMTFDGLYSEKNHNYYLAAAQNHHISKDGLTHTFTIENSFWQDGTKVTAEDFEAGFKLFVSPNTGAGLGDLILGTRIKNSRCTLTGNCPLESLGVKALNPKTLQITLEVPNEDLPHYLSNVVFAPTKAREKYPDDFGTESTKIMTNGPYQFVAKKEGEFFALQPNPHYKGPSGKAYLKRISMTVESSDRSATSNALRTQSVDLIAFSDPETRQELNHQSHIKIESYKDLAISFFVFNERTPYFQDPEIREMFANAIDRRGILKALNGSVAPSDHIIPENLPGIHNKQFNQIFKYPPLKYSSQRSRELSQRIKKSEKKKILPKELKMHIHTSPIVIKTAERLQNDFQKNLGVKLNLLSSDFKNYLIKRKESDISLISWVADVPLADNFLSLVEGSNNVFNDGGINDPEFNELFQLASKFPLGARLSVYHGAEQLMIKRHHVVPFSTPNVAIAHHKNLEGIVPPVDLRNAKWTTSTKKP